MDRDSTPTSMYADSPTRRLAWLRPATGITVRRTLPRHFLVALIVMIVAIQVAACGNGSPTVAAPTPSVPTPPATLNPLRSVSIEGQGALTSIGQTSQLMAKAFYQDGASKDVTTEVTWKSNNESVATISAAGLVTATGPGQAQIFADYQTTLSGPLDVTVTPPGTVVLSGRAREPGMGGTIGEGVPDVRFVDTQSGQSWFTDRSGHYTRAGVALGARVTADKEGYEPAAFIVTSGNGSVDIQRIVRVMAGDSLQTLLHDTDMRYDTPQGVCFPCRLIRVVCPTAGALELHLAWDRPENVLNIWINGRRFEGSGGSILEARADATVEAGEVVVFVGSKDSYRQMTSIKLTTVVHPATNR
jgi:Big-like domain-containing protein